MDKVSHARIFGICLGVFLSFLAPSAFAYLGPGAGLGLIGSLIAVVVVAFVVVFGLILYPIRIYRRKQRERSAIDVPEEKAD